MELIMNVAGLIWGFFDVLFAIPVLGALFLLGTLGPVVVAAVKHK